MSRHLFHILLQPAEGLLRLLLQSIGGLLESRQSRLHFVHRTFKKGLGPPDGLFRQVGNHFLQVFLKPALSCVDSLFQILLSEEEDQLDKCRHKIFHKALVGLVMQFQGGLESLCRKIRILQEIGNGEQPCIHFFLVCVKLFRVINGQVIQNRLGEFVRLVRQSGFYTAIQFLASQKNVLQLFLDLFRDANLGVNLKRAFASSFAGGIMRGDFQFVATLVIDVFSLGLGLLRPQEPGHILDRLFRKDHIFPGAFEEVRGRPYEKCASRLEQFLDAGELIRLDGDRLLVDKVGFFLQFDQERRQQGNLDRFFELLLLRGFSLCFNIDLQFLHVLLSRFKEELRGEVFEGELSVFIGCSG